MTVIVRSVVSAGFCLTLCLTPCLTGCNAGSTQRDRTVKAFAEPDGKRHPETIDVNANAVATCKAASGQSGDLGCTVRDPDGFPTNLKLGASMTLTQAGKATVACMGIGALHCEVEIKD